MGSDYTSRVDRRYVGGVGSPFDVEIAGIIPRVDLRLHLYTGILIYVDRRIGRIDHCAALILYKSERKIGYGRRRGISVDDVNEYSVIHVGIFVFARIHLNDRVAGGYAEQFAVSYFNDVFVERLPEKTYGRLAGGRDGNRELFRGVDAYRYFFGIIFVTRHRVARSDVHFVGIIYRVRKRDEIVYTINPRIERIVVDLKIEVFVGDGLILDRLVIIGYVERYGRG